MRNEIAKLKANVWKAIVVIFCKPESLLEPTWSEGRICDLSQMFLEYLPWRVSVSTQEYYTKFQWLRCTRPEITEASELAIGAFRLQRIAGLKDEQRFWT